jgi:hypothetical protein
MRLFLFMDAPLDTLNKFSAASTEAARIRGAARAAIRDLIRREGLRSAAISGRELVYRSGVEAFEREKPGPKTEYVLPPDTSSRNNDEGVAKNKNFRVLYDQVDALREKVGCESAELPVRGVANEGRTDKLK